MSIKRKSNNMIKVIDEDDYTEPRMIAEIYNQRRPETILKRKSDD